jgi:RHS repeat-associated protein
MPTDVPISIVSEADTPEETPVNPAPMALMTQPEAATDPDIVSLAASLGNNSLKIFNYVRNKIRYEHYYGLKKGAVMTLVEGSGNDYDQCALLKALLVAAGETNISLVSRPQAIYLVGNDGKNTTDWLGLAEEPYPGQTYLQAFGKPVPTAWVTAGITDAQAKRLQHTGNFVSGLGSPSIQLWDDYVRLVFPRVWLRLGTGSGAKDLDPSFKRSQWIPPVNIATLAGYSRTNLLAAVTTTGQTVTGPGWVQKLNKAGLTSYLDGITGTLTDELLSLYPNSTVEEIVGGRRIIAEDATSLSDCFPLGTTFHPFVGETVWPGDIPVTHMVKVRFQSGTIDYTVPTAELGDERVSLSFSGNTMKLWVGDIEKGSTSVPDLTTSLTMSVIHPGTLGTTPPQTAIYKKHNTYAYALIHAFSPSGKSLHRRYQKLEAYLDNNLADDSFEVRAELLNIMGLTWLYQTRLVSDLMAARHKVLTVEHHRFGRVGQESGFYIDVALQLSGATGSDGNEQDFGAAFYGRSLFASAMEHGIIEQLQPGYSAVSTVNLIRAANDNSQKLYLADINNWNAGATADRVKGQLTNYSDPTKAAIETEINLGRKAFLPKNANITQGIWTGTGYVIRGFQTLGLPAGQTRGTSVAGMIISGGYGGGWSTSSGYVSSAAIYSNSFYNPVYSYAPPVASFESYSVPSYFSPTLFGADPVDMATGAFTYGATDLETGLEPAPRGLRLGRYYTSNSRDKNSQNIGYGWTHDLYIRAEKRTASEEGLGLGSPRQAALMLTAVLTAADIFREDATPKEWGAAVLAAGWGVDRLTNNAVSIIIGQQVIQFTTRADGSFEPPTGSVMELVATGSGSSASYSLKQNLGNTIAFQYNSTLKVHRASTITDPDSKSLSFAYLTDGRINYVQDAYSRRYTFGYTGTGANALITSVTDSTGRLVSYGYGTDGNKNLCSFTDPEGKTENYDYTLTGDPVEQAALHRIRRVRNRLGSTVTENDYDSFGRVGFQRLHGDPDKTYTLHYTGRVNSETNPEGGVTTYFYDDRGRSSATEDPEGNRTSWEYDGQDHVIEKTTGSGETTIYHYDDPSQNITQIDHPRGGGSTHMVYDSLGRIDLVTDPDGNQTDYIYNAGNTKDRPDQVIDPAGTTTYQYKTTGAAIGRVWKITDHDGLLTEIEYDTNGHPDWMKDPGGFTTQTTYTARGDLQDITDPNTIKTFHTYNDRRQVTQTITDQGGADQAVHDFTYDDQGNPDSATSPPDNDNQRFKLRQQFSPTNKVRFTRTTDEDGEGDNDPATEIRYDARDWQREILDPLNRLTSLTPFPNGNLQSTSLPLGRGSSTLYDGDGRPVSSTSPGSSGVRTSSIVYSATTATATGFPTTSVTTPDNLAISETQDHSGRTRFYTNRKNKTWEFRYDGLGRRTHTITPLDGTANRAEVTEYHHRGAVKKRTAPSGQVTNFIYNSTSGRLNSITDGVGTISHTLYDSNGNLKTTSETRAGVSGTKTTGRTYDRQNRLLSRTDENGQTIGYRYFPSGKLKTLIYPGGTETGTGHVEYTWWKSGNLKQVIDKLDSTTTPRTTSYEWNTDGRLKKVTRTNNTCREIKYDAAGRPEIIEEYGPDRKLIFVHKQGYYPSDEMAWRYELPAKRTSGSDPPAMRAMTYNADNQLDTWNGLSVTHDPDGNMTQGPAPDSGSLVSYSYDARNRLTSALGTTYTYDADNQRVGLTKTGEITTFAIDVSSALSKLLVRTKNGVATRYVWGLGLLYEVNGTGSGATTATYHHDATGSTLALTDSTGKVIERIGYTPFGQINHRVNLSGTPHDTPFLFTGFFGNQTDANGLLYMRARYYHPRLGRFLNADPAQEGMNWYGYAAGNPIGYVDPMGLGIDGALDAVQNTLSFLGMIPVFGAAFDIVNAGISIGRGNYVDAAINFASALPGLGDMVGGAKILAGGAAAYGGYKAISALSRVESYGARAVRAGSGVADSVMVIGRQADTAVFRGQAGYHVLDIHPQQWNLNVNDAWVQAGIDTRTQFKMATETGFTNLTRRVQQADGSFRHEPSIYLRELKQLRDAGYSGRGGIMVP